MSIRWRSAMLSSTMFLACGGSPRPAAQAAPSAPSAAASAPLHAPVATAASTTAQVYAPADPKYAFSDPDRKKKLTSAFAEIDTIVADEMARQKIPGAVVGVVIDGELIYAKGFGVSNLDKKTKPDEDTVFRIGSISKSFIGLAALSLRDEGVIDFDDPLVKYVPQAAGLVYPTRDSAPITLRHLLMHTSGLPRENPAVLRGTPGEAEMLKLLAGLALENAPGSTHVYSNLGYALLGLALGRAAGTSSHDVVKKWVLEPYAMKGAVWTKMDVPLERMASGYMRFASGEIKPAPLFDLGSDDPSGGLFASLRDMGRYAAAQLAAYPPRSGPEDGGLRRSSLREAHSGGAASLFHVALANLPKNGDSLVNAAADSYAFGWNARRTCAYDDLVWHNGGLAGYSSDIRFLKDRGVGVIAFTNLFPAEGEAANISARVLRALAQSGGLSKRSLPPAPQFDPLMKKLLAVYNEWDETGYESLLTAQRPPMVAVEKEELAGYKELHGVCKEYKFVEAEPPRSATFSLDCEHGPLEMRLLISPKDGLLTGFVGTTHGLPVPKELRRAAEKVAGLIRKWDGAIFSRHFAKGKKTSDAAATNFEALRTQHGACTVGTSTMVSDERTIHLECERGGNLDLRLELDKKDSNQVLMYTLSAKEGVCPVR
jgi:CubicO group peptidase (beta-lactamase class C family)